MSLQQPVHRRAISPGADSNDTVALSQRSSVKVAARRFAHNLKRAANSVTHVTWGDEEARVVDGGRKHVTIFGF